MSRLAVRIATSVALVAAVVIVDAGPVAASAAAFNEYPLPLCCPHGRASRAPFDITTGADGNLWFTENYSGLIGRMTTNGTLVAEYVIPRPAGLDPSQTRPYGITTGPDGALWFTMGSCGGLSVPPQPCMPGSIGRITTSGQISEFPIGSPLPPNATLVPEPYGITVGPDGALWFTDLGTLSIGRITTSGVITEYPVVGQQPRPLNITAGPDGNLWFTDAGNVYFIGKITTSGQISEFPTPEQTTNSPDAITAGPDGALWFTEGNYVGRITTSATVLNTTITEYSLPHCVCGATDITTGNDGTLWLSGATSNELDNVTVAGAVTEYPVPTANSNPDGITMGPDGNVWFTEQDANAIGVLGAGAFGPPQVSISDATVKEPAKGQTQITFTVTLNRPSAQPVLLGAATEDGTATHPEDYLSTGAALYFTPGQTSEALAIQVNADPKVGGNSSEYFYVNLYPPTNAVIADGQGVGTITQR